MKTFCPARRRLTCRNSVSPNSLLAATVCRSAAETLAAGAGVFGVLYGFFGAGALAGAITAAARGRLGIATLLVGTGGMSAASIVIAPLRSVALCAVLLFVIGACWSLWATVNR